MDFLHPLCPVPSSDFALSRCVEQPDKIEHRTSYEDNILATGYGTYLAIPILRKKWRPDLEEGEARCDFR